MTSPDLLLAALFFAVAVLYSSVGHAGASGYIASMALLGFAPEQVRPTALALNLLVGGIGLYRWWRGGHVRWRNVLPFVLASAPAAFFSAQIKLPKESYSLLLGIVLLVAAIGVFRHASRAESEDAAAQGRNVPWLAGLLVGAAIGTLSGLTGTGGGIFLSPFILLMGWAGPKATAGISAPFIMANSIAGLAGGLIKGSFSFATIPFGATPLIAAALLGALIGTWLGLYKLTNRWLIGMLALVMTIAAAKLIGLSL